jgi:hypothetical protein
MPHVILFEHANFHGKHMHVFQAEPNLNNSDDPQFNDIASSIVILDGRWEFFANWNFDKKLGQTLGPSLYPWVEAALGHGSNDTITSLRPDIKD